MVEYDGESGLVSPSSSRGGGLQLPDFEESDFYVEQEQVINQVLVGCEVRSLLFTCLASTGGKF